MKRYIFLLMGFLWGIVSAFSSSLLSFSEDYIAFAYK